MSAAKNTGESTITDGIITTKEFGPPARYAATIITGAGLSGTAVSQSPLTLGIPAQA